MCQARRWSWAHIAGWLVLLQSFLNSCFSDTVFVTLLCTVVKTAISDVHNLLRTGGVPISITLFLAVAVGLISLRELERADELFILRYV